MYRIQLVGKLTVDLIFVGLTSYLQITPTTGFTINVSAGKQSIPLSLHTVHLSSGDGTFYQILQIFLKEERKRKIT